MTRMTNARIAGFTYLFYIAVALPSMVLMNRATSAEGTAAKLARVAEHASDVRIVIVLTRSVASRPSSWAWRCTGSRAMRTTSSPCWQ